MKSPDRKLLMCINLLRPALTGLLAAALLTAAVASQPLEANQAQQQQAPPQNPPAPPIPGLIPGLIPGQGAPAQAPTTTPAQAPVTPAQTPTTVPAQAPVTPAPTPTTVPAQTPVTPAQTPTTPPAQAPVTAAPTSTTTPAQPQTPPDQTPPAAPPQTQTVPAQTQPTTPIPAGLDFQIPNGSLSDFIDHMAQHLKINYILDPAVAGRGSVSLFTYGEQRPTDLMTLLQTVLRVNGATIVKVGDIYRIIPVIKISNLPLEPMMNIDQKTLPEDERMVLDLIFLQFSTASEIDHLISPFMGEGAQHSFYEPANLLIVQDNARNMRRTLQLIDMFDSETFAGQRVKLFQINNSRPTDMAKELDTIFKAYSLSEKTSPVKFIPVDRINTIIAVAPNPGVFPQIKTWLDKLDVAVKSQAGEVNTYVYRMKYQRAETTALAITAVYTGNVEALIGMAMMMQNGGMGMGGMGMGGGGMGGMGGGMGGYGGYGGTNGGYGGNNMLSSIMGSMYGNGGSNNGGSNGQFSSIPPVSAAPAGSANPAPAGANSDMTGSYLGLANAQSQNGGQRAPHIIPNPFDNTLLIQANPSEWEQINNLLRQIDVPPRQVLIEAKIYELDMNGAFSEGVQAYLEKKDANATGLGRALTAATSSAGLNLSLGLLAGRAKEVLGVLQSAEHRDQARVISSPSIMTTDSIPATMNVGQDVPVLTSSAVASGVQSNGSNVFTNTVSNRSTGVTLTITARINSSGVVTMIIDQDVSSPQPPSAGGIQSPSFSRRSFNTQLTVQDGDTVAIGGFIQETSGWSSDGVPLLHRIPLLGGLFGAKANNKGRTELIIFITPKVLYDTNSLIDATEEIKGRLRTINSIMKDQ